MVHIHGPWSNQKFSIRANYHVVLQVNTVLTILNSGHRKWTRHDWIKEMAEIKLSDIDLRELTFFYYSLPP